MFMLIKKILDKTLESLLMVSVAFLVIDVLWQVLIRYSCSLLKITNPTPWTEDLATYLLVWVALLGAAVALGRGAHLGIDYFTSKMSLRARLLSEAFVFIVIALFAAAAMVYGGMDLVKSTLELGQISATLKIKMGYVYLAVPVSGCFMVMYSLIGLSERLGALSKIGELTPTARVAGKDIT